MGRKGNYERPTEITPLVLEVTEQYWNSSIKIPDLMAYHGFKNTHELSRYVIPSGVERTCVRCGESFVAFYTSRDNLRNQPWHHELWWPGNPKGWHCGECIEITYIELRQPQPKAQERRPTPKPAVAHEPPQMLTYAEYLQSEHWRRFRSQRLEAVNYSCQLCNRRGRLHVHHRTYERLGRELPSDVIVLCETCHQAFHDRMGMPVKE